MKSKNLSMQRMVVWGLTLVLAVAFILVGDGTASADAIALAQTVQAGEAASFTVSIRNDTSDSHTYTPALTGMPGGVAISFSEGGPLVEKFEIPGQTATQIEIHVKTQPDTSVGFYQGQFMVTRDDGVTLQVPVELAVENTYALQITGQALNLSVFSGKEFSFDLAATNTGASAVSNVHLQVETPPKWIVRTDPPQIATLAASDSASFHVTVLTPASQMAIDQPIKVTVVSDQVTSADATMMVRVQKSPNFLYSAALLIGVVVAGVFIYFRRQGRR